MISKCHHEACRPESLERLDAFDDFPVLCDSRQHVLFAFTNTSTCVQQLATALTRDTQLIMLASPIDSRKIPAPWKLWTRPRKQGTRAKGLQDFGSPPLHLGLCRKGQDTHTGLLGIRSLHKAPERTAQAAQVSEKILGSASKSLRSFSEPRPLQLVLWHTKICDMRTQTPGLKKMSASKAFQTGLTLK